jgi:hypothetical protein
MAWSWEAVLEADRQRREPAAARARIPKRYACAYSRSHATVESAASITARTRRGLSDGFHFRDRILYLARSDSGWIGGLRRGFFEFIALVPLISSCFFFVDIAAHRRRPSPGWRIGNAGVRPERQTGCRRQGAGRSSRPAIFAFCFPPRVCDSPRLPPMRAPRCTACGRWIGPAIGRRLWTGR